MTGEGRIAQLRAGARVGSLLLPRLGRNLAVQRRRQPAGSLSPKGRMEDLGGQVYPQVATRGAGPATPLRPQPWPAV
jgi:hypothetical protein